MKDPRTGLAPAAPGLRRRQLAWAAAGLGAAAAGGATWYAIRAASDEAQALWALTLPTPQGDSLRLAAWRGRPLIINFWATWCAPCLQEMPMLDRFQAGEGGLPVLGLAADKLEATQQFLRRLPVRFPIAVLPPGGLDLTRQLGNEGGGLPYSLLMGRRGEVLARHRGQLELAQLRDWASRV